MVLVSQEVYASIIGQQLAGVEWPAGLPVRVNWPFWPAIHEKIGYVAHEVQGLSTRLLAVDVPGVTGKLGPRGERVYILVRRLDLVPFGLGQT